MWLLSGVCIPSSIVEGSARMTLFNRRQRLCRNLALQPTKVLAAYPILGEANESLTRHTRVAAFSYARAGAPIGAGSIQSELSTESIQSRL